MIDRRIDSFRGGDPGVRDKLNEIIELINSFKQLKGDEIFIGVRRGPGGATIELNINQVLARIPKSTGSGDGVLRPATLEQNDGLAGDASSFCSYTYDVTDAATGLPVATDVALDGNGPRIAAVTCVNSATRGIYWMEGNTCHLIWCDEQYDDVLCEEPP